MTARTIYRCAVRALVGQVPQVVNMSRADGLPDDTIRLPAEPR
jgi:hypothetical protein